MTINDLRKKTQDEKLSKKAKALIKDWKNLLENKTTTVNLKSRKLETDNNNQEIKSPSTESQTNLNVNNNDNASKISTNIPIISEVKKNPDEVKFFIIIIFCNKNIF